MILKYLGNGLCPPDWLNILGKCYYFPTGPENYGDNSFANVFCQNHNGKLFEPKNNYINVQVAQVAKTVFKKANIMNDQNLSMKVRIGVNDQETEGEWKYNSDGSKVTWNFPEHIKFNSEQSKEQSLKSEKIVQF